MPLSMLHLAHAFVNAAPILVFVHAFSVSMPVCVDICYGVAIAWENAMVCNEQRYCVVYMW